MADELFLQLKARSVAEGLSFKLLIEKTGYAYLRQPMSDTKAENVVLPVAGDGTGSVLVDPSNWWDDMNERS